MGNFFFLLFVFLVLSFFCGRYVLKNKNSYKSNITLLLWSVLLSLMIGEIYFRFFYVKSDAFGVLGSNFAKRYYKKDKWGFRDSLLPLSTKRPNIIIAGDSFVFGHGIKNPESRYSNILRKRCRNLHIVNLGKNGATTIDESVLLLKNYRPEAKTALIFVNYIFNDIEDSIPKDKRYNRRPPSKTIRRLLKLSELMKHLYYRCIYPAGTMKKDYMQMLTMAYKNDAILQDHINALKVLRYIVHELYQAQLVIIVWPDLTNITYTIEYKKMMGVFKQLGIPCIDLVMHFKGLKSSNLIVSKRDPHPNEKANRIVSDIVYHYIINEVKGVPCR